MRGLIKATAYYSNLAARQDWVEECRKHGIDPDIIDWQRMGHRKLDAALLKLRQSKSTKDCGPIPDEWKQPYY